MQEPQFDVVWPASAEEQSTLVQGLRPRTATVEFVFHTPDVGHPLAVALESLHPERRVGVGVRPGYSRPDPGAVLHRYRYDRAIFSALDQLGGLFTRAGTPRGERTGFTELGNLDVALLDADGNILLATVTHEAMILVHRDTRPTE